MCARAVCAVAHGLDTGIDVRVRCIACAVCAVAHGLGACVATRPGRTSITMLEVGNAAGNAGPTFFLLSGSKATAHKGAFADPTFLVRHGAAPGSKMIMTPSGCAPHSLLSVLRAATVRARLRAHCTLHVCNGVVPPALLRRVWRAGNGAVQPKARHPPPPASSPTRAHGACRARTRGTRCAKAFPLCTVTGPCTAACWQGNVRVHQLITDC